MYPGHWSKVFPNKPAVVHASTGESVTYQQLDDRSNQLAQLMWYQGLRKGDHISIFMENNLAFFEVVWAALRSGLYLSTVNQYLTEDEAAYIVDNSESQVLVSSNQLSAVAAKLPARCPAVKRWFMVDGAVEGYEDYSESISVHPAKNLDEEPAGTFMLYSSGTTGRPKGILKPLPSSLISDDSGVLGGLQKSLWGFDQNTVYLSPAPLYHSAPVGFCTGVQALGGTVIMLPKFNELQALQAIQDHQVTHSQWVPTMFSRMLKIDEAERKVFDL